MPEATTESTVVPLISTVSIMEGDCELEIPSTAVAGFDSIPTIHVDTHGRVMSPTLPTASQKKPSDPTLSSSKILKPGMGPTDGRPDESATNAVPPTPSLIHFLFAIFSISLALFVLFLAVAWFTVLRETRLMKDQVLSNADGVSPRTY